MSNKYKISTNILEIWLCSLKKIVKPDRRYRNNSWRVWLCLEGSVKFIFPHKTYLASTFNKSLRSPSLSGGDL